MESLKQKHSTDNSIKQNHIVDSVEPIVEQIPVISQRESLQAQELELQLLELEEQELKIRKEKLQLKLKLKQLEQTQNLDSKLDV